MTNALTQITQDVATMRRIVVATEQYDYVKARELAKQLNDPLRRALVLPTLDGPPLPVTPESTIGMARAATETAQTRYDLEHQQLTELDTALTTAQQRLSSLLKQPVSGKPLDMRLEASISATRREIEQLQEQRGERAPVVADLLQRLNQASGKLQEQESLYWSWSDRLERLVSDYQTRHAAIVRNMADLTGTVEA